MTISLSTKPAFYSKKKKDQQYSGVKILVSKIKIKSQLNKDRVNKRTSKYKLACLLCHVEREKCVSFYARLYPPINMHK